MGLFELLRKLKNDDREMRILMLGLDNVGKTTILKNLQDEDITHIMPTQGFNVKTLMHDGFKINSWDINGQRSIREYYRNYYDQTDCLVYVVDSADRRRTEETGNELQQLLDEDKLKSVPLLVIANKQDLLNALTLEEITKELSLNEIKDREWKIFPCSAKTREGLQESFEWLVSNANNIRSEGITLGGVKSNLSFRDKVRISVSNIMDSSSQSLSNKILSLIRTKNQDSCFLCFSHLSSIHYQCPKCDDYKICDLCEENYDNHSHNLMKIKPRKILNNK